MPAKLKRFQTSKYDLTKLIVYFFTFLVIFLSISVLIFIFIKSIPFIWEQKGLEFLWNNNWEPGKGNYGFWNFIVSTFWTLFFVIVLVFFINKFVAIFITKFLPRKIRKAVIFALQVLSGLPSILFGVFVSLIFIEFLSTIGIPKAKSKSMLSAIVVLTFIILPTTLTLTINKIISYPKNFVYSGYATGMKKTIVAFDIVYRGLRSEIYIILLFGFFRAIGEVTAVALVSGGNSDAPDLMSGFPDFFFTSITLLSSLIGSEVKENFGPIHESALFTVSLLIMFIVFISNLLVLAFLNSSHFSQGLFQKISNFFFPSKKENFKAADMTDPKITKQKINKFTQMKKWFASGRFFYWKFLDYYRKFFMFGFFVIVVAFFVWIVGDITWRGIAGFDFSRLVTTSGESGLLSMIVITLLLIVGTLILSIPVAFFTALYLNEYAGPHNKFAKVVKILIFQLASSPSVVFGMFGLAFFVSFLGFGFTILAGCFTMILVVFPLVIQTIIQNLKSVPQSYRLIGFALGLSRQQVIWKIVVPNSIKGIVISLVFAANRVISETAPYVIILGGGTRFPSRGFLSTGRTLSTQMYYLQTETLSEEADNITYQTALLALLIILATNLLIHQLKKTQKRNKNIKFI